MSERLKDKEMFMRYIMNSARKIYLSYSFKDSETIRIIGDRLRNFGFEIVSCDIGLGSNVYDVLSKVISECDCVIWIISKGLSDSILKEYEIANDMGKRIFVYIQEKVCKDSLSAQIQNKIVRLWNDETELIEEIIADISRYAYMYPQRGYAFELFVRELFEAYGCKIESTGNTQDRGYDWIAHKNKINFYVDVKLRREKVIDHNSLISALTASQLMEKSENSVFVIIVANKLSTKTQECISKRENLIVIDVDNLLYLVKNDEELKAKLLFLLEFSVDDIEEKEPRRFLKLLGKINVRIEENNSLDNLVDEIRDWDPNLKTSYEYEDLCVRVLSHLFVAELGLWKGQQRSNKDLFRFDLICKIKDDVNEGFWRFIESYFRSKYIIFEFKNYKEKITQREIYTTEKYLYAKALRNVAVIISCNGEDGNARKAINGILRENGKLMLSITNMDMINMLEEKKKNKSPAEYLYNMLDNILVELDK